LFFSPAREVLLQRAGWLVLSLLDERQIDQIFAQILVTQERFGHDVAQTDKSLPLRGRGGVSQKPLCGDPSAKRGKRSQKRRPWLMSRSRA